MGADEREHRPGARWSRTLRRAALLAGDAGLPLLVALVAADAATTAAGLLLAARGAAIYEGTAIYWLLAEWLHVPVAAVLVAGAPMKLALAWAVGRWWRHLARAATRPYFDYAFVLLCVAASCALLARVVVDNFALVLGALR